MRFPRVVVLGPDLLVSLACRLAGPPDRARVDRARLAPGDAAPVAHHVVRRAREPALAHQVLADRAHLRGLAGHPEVAVARGPVDRLDDLGEPALPVAGRGQPGDVGAGREVAGAGRRAPRPRSGSAPSVDSAIRAIAGSAVRSPTSISQAASAGIANEPLGSVIVTVSPTHVARPPTR